MKLYILIQACRNKGRVWELGAAASLRGTQKKKKYKLGIVKDENNAA